jgi:hypothetical protein
MPAIGSFFNSKHCECWIDKFDFQVVDIYCHLDWLCKSDPRRRIIESHFRIFEASLQVLPYIGLITQIPGLICLGLLIIRFLVMLIVSIAECGPCRADLVTSMFKHMISTHSISYPGNKFHCIILAKELCHWSLRRHPREVRWHALGQNVHANCLLSDERNWRPSNRHFVEKSNFGFPHTYGPSGQTSNTQIE